MTQPWRYGNKDEIPGMVSIADFMGWIKWWLISHSLSTIFTLVSSKLHMLSNECGRYCISEWRTFSWGSRCANKSPFSSSFLMNCNIYIRKFVQKYKCLLLSTLFVLIGRICNHSYLLYTIFVYSLTETSTYISEVAGSVSTLRDDCVTRMPVHPGIGCQLLSWLVYKVSRIITCSPRGLLNRFHYDRYCQITSQNREYISGISEVIRVM